MDGAIDVTFPIASFPSSSFSSFMLSNFSLSLSPLAIAQDTSVENKLGLFIGVIKKTKKKESVVTRSVKNQNCHFIRAMNLFFFHRFQLYTGSPNFTFRFFPDSFLLFLFPSPFLSPSAIFRVKMENNMGTINARFDKLSPLKRETGERATHSIPACIHR